MVVKLKLKSPTQKLKKFDSWPKLNSKGKWNVNLTWDESDDSKWY